MRVLAILFLAAAPAVAYASGGDVLSLLWLEVALFAAVLLSLAFGKLSTGGKWLVLAAYFVGVVTPWYLTATWPYSDNLLLINALCIGTPLLLWFSAFVIARRRFGKHNNALQSDAPRPAGSGRA